MRTVTDVSATGLFVDVGSHALDLLDFLLGPLQRLSGVAVRGAQSDAADPEDAVAISFACGERLETTGGAWGTWGNYDPKL